MAPVTDFASVRNAQFQYTIFGQLVQNGIYFASDAEGSASLETLGDNLIDWWVTNIRPILGSNLTFRQLDLVDAYPNESGTFTRNTGLPVDGTASGEALPSNVAFVISFRTATGGRKGRGRNYMVGITEGQSNGAQITESVATALRTAYELLMGPDAIATGWTWVVASRVGSTDGEPTNVYPINSVVVTDLSFDSQRRRLPGRGR